MEEDAEMDGEMGQNLNDHHAQEEVHDLIQKDAAKRKMLQIAKRIAETTPAIIDRK